MRDKHAAKWQGGATRMELAVSIAVVGILAAALLERLLYVEEYAEKTAMELTIANMQAGLRARIGNLLIEGQPSRIPTLAGANPVEFLDKHPDNYLGALEVSPDGRADGNWYFDINRRELVYTANNTLHFVPSAYRDYTVRLRVMPVHAAANPGGGKPGAQQDWVALGVVNDYRWF